MVGPKLLRVDCKRMMIADDPPSTPEWTTFSAKVDGYKHSVLVYFWYSMLGLVYIYGLEHQIIRCIVYRAKQMVMIKCCFSSYFLLYMF